MKKRLFVLMMFMFAFAMVLPAKAAYCPSSTMNRNTTKSFDIGYYNYNQLKKINLKSSNSGVASASKLVGSKNKYGQYHVAIKVHAKKKGTATIKYWDKNMGNTSRKITVK